MPLPGGVNGDSAVDVAKLHRRSAAMHVEIGLQLALDGGQIRLSPEPLRLDAPADRRRLHSGREAAAVRGEPISP